MKRIKRAAALLLCLLLILGAGNVQAAARDGGEAVPEIPTVTFKNKENTTPDLNVVKYVESLDTAYPAPADAEFTFVIKVDGELYKRQEYELYRAGTPGKAPELHTTTRNGTFTLKAGDRARFVYLGAGKHYEVYEETLPDRFIQIIPAEGTSVIGTVPPGGALAAFTNQYLPPNEPEPDTTRLLISKRISFPTGYTPPEASDFRFRLTLDGKLYEEEPYEIYSLDTGLLVGKGVTGGTYTTAESEAAPGEFTLKAGQQAVFANIPVNVDYKVEELLEEGWWSTNDVTVQEGATASPVVTVNFTNANASFIVTKQLEDNTKPDKEFTFTLSKGDRTHWADAKYYLYSTKGELLEEKEYQTNANGEFVLKPGQAAVFFGIQPGTLYHVSEKKDPQYSQITPTDPAGYTDKVVQKTVEVLPFINRKEEIKGVLTVTKHLLTEDGIVPENQETFTFCIRQGTQAAEPGGEMQFEPMKDIPYQISSGTTVQTMKTDESGCFALKAGETARFESLLKGTYQVEEMKEGLSPEYSIDETKRIQQAELSVQDEAGVEFIFENRYAPVPLSIRLKKTGWLEGNLLSGAVFRLYREYQNDQFIDEVLPENWDKDHPGQKFDGYKTGQDGVVTIEKLQAGTYYLKETKAPEGYQLLANPLKILITRNGSRLEATVNSIKPSIGTDGQITMADENTIEIRIKNSRNFTLPSTGGTGIAFWLAAAGAMTLLLIILWKKGKVKIK